MKTKIAILGSGMLGAYLDKYFEYYDKSKYFVKMYSQNAVDITDYKAVESIVSEFDYILNCAAYTNVDKAELEPELCYAVNADAVNNLAQLCNKYNKKLVHISTDFIYGEDEYRGKQICKISEYSCKNPLNIYGKSKIQGESNVLSNMLDNYLILRVSWTFGPTGNNFIKKIAEQLLDKNKTCIEVVDDQFGRPTSINLIAEVIDNYIQGNIKSSTYNLQNAGKPVSKYELAKFIGKVLKSKVKVHHCSSDKFPGAKRQYNSYLDCSKLCKELNFDRKDWKEEVFEYLFILYLYPEKVILKKNKQGRLQKLWLMIKNLF
jgi:dTDP-4-dehydrorhamnose reductase